MVTTAAVGRSEAPHARDAGRQAARDALADLEGGRADLCLVFTTAEHDPRELLAGVRECSGEARIVGCSGEGIITRLGSEEREHRVAVMAVRSTSMRFETRLAGAYGEDPAACASDLARGWRDAGDLVGLVVFTDGLSGDCNRFLEALRDGLPPGTTVLGGAAADSFQFERTYQFTDTESASGAVSALAIRGTGRLEVGVSHGCCPIGLERVITKTEGGWVLEIDGRPAWSEFREYLDGEPENLKSEGLPHLCIGLPHEGPAADLSDAFNIRTPMRLDRGTGALFFPGGGFAEGQRIRLTRRDPVRIRESARTCAEELRRRNPSRSPAFVLQCDCAGRGQLIFGAHASSEIVDPLRKTLGLGVPWIGLHTFGEIAPVDGRAVYHNYSVALGALYDAGS